MSEQLMEFVEKMNKMEKESVGYTIIIIIITIMVKNSLWDCEDILTGH